MLKEYFGCVINIKEVAMVNQMFREEEGVNYFGIQIHFKDGSDTVFDHYGIFKEDRDNDYRLFVDEEVVD